MKLVNIVRDGRDVACSVVREGWGPEDHADALEWWAANVCLAAKAQERIPRTAYFNVRYEDLVAEPAAVLRRIVRFLGVEWDDQLLSKELSSASVGRWRRDLPSEARSCAEEKYGQILSGLGYDC